MKNLIRLEEVGLLLLSIALFSLTGYAWWWFPVLILAPDISMAGYAINIKTGAALYNLFHHRGVAILVYLSGIYLSHSIAELAGIILLAHSSLDRIFGYDLKYTDSFKHTHLGWIGENPDNR